MNGLDFLLITIIYFTLLHLYTLWEVRNEGKREMPRDLASVFRR